MKLDVRRVGSIIAIALSFVVVIIATFVDSMRVTAFVFTLVIYVASLVSHAMELRRPDADRQFIRIARLVALVPFVWAIALAIIQLKG